MQGQKPTVYKWVKTLLYPMTYRINEKDLSGQLDRLNRNTDNKIIFAIEQYNGYYHLAVMDKPYGCVLENISNGNTKNELYWQMVAINKVLEQKRQVENQEYVIEQQRRLEKWQNMK